MRSPSGDLAVLAKEADLSTAVHPAPRSRVTPRRASGPPLAERLCESVDAGTARLGLRQRALFTHLTVVTLMSVAALIGVLTR